MNDEDFKQACIDKSFNESCKKDLDRYIELANQAKKAVSKYFERKDIELQAYYTGANDADRVLNINLTNHDGNGPIRISDILQQEKNISELNVYCNKKHDIYAYRKNKERHYKFEESAYYEMTSTWPIKDEHGKVVSTCIMVMNVNSDGITEILKFNDRSFTASDEVLGLIEQNHELYIQGLSLYDAVKALLERNKNAPLPDVVPTANNNLQNNEPIRVDQDKELDRQGLENNANNDPIFPTNSDASTKTEVNLQQSATQVEIHSQPIATQQEINDLQRELEEERQKNVELKKYSNDLQNKCRKEEQKNIELQASLAQKDEELANLREKTQELEGVYKENENLKKKMEELLNKLRKLQEKLHQLEEKNYRLENENDQLKRSNKGLEKEKEQLWQKILVLKEVSLSLEVEKQELSDKLSNNAEKQIKLEQELIKARQEIEKLRKENNSLQAEHEKKEQKLKKEIGKMREKIIQINEKREEREQEVQEFCKENENLKKKLRLANVENRKLEDELEKSKRAEQQTYEDTELVISEYYKTIQDLCAQLQRSEQEKQEAEECYKRAIEKLAYKIEDLKNELESEKKQKEQLQQEIKEIEKECLRLLELKLEGYENEIEMLKERDEEWKEMFKELQKIVADKVQKIKKVKDELFGSTEKTEDLNKQVEYLIETLSTEIYQLFASKQKIFNDRAKTFYTLAGNIDDSGKELSLDSAYHSDDDSYSYDSPLSFVSNPVQVNSACTSQSERSNHSSIYPQSSFP